MINIFTVNIKYRYVYRHRVTRTSDSGYRRYYTMYFLHGPGPVE